MSLRINTNMSALNALRNVQNAADNFGRSIERLASGLRVVRAADDPAGLIRSEDLRAQIVGLEQAIANAQDASNLVKTAEGALEEIHTLLRSMRQLAVASANTGTNDLTALQANQNQIRSAIDSIDRIAMQTQFGTKKLLDGTAGVRAVVTDPANVGGIFVGGSVYGTVNGTAGEYRIASGAVSIKVTQVARRAEVTSAGLQNGTTLASTVAQAVGNNVPGTLVINGVSFTTDGNETLASFLDRINSASSVTGVVAVFVPASGTDPARITFRAVEYGSKFNFTISTSRAGFFFTQQGQQNLSVTGQDAQAEVQFSVYQANGALGTATVAFRGGRGPTDSGLRLTDDRGNVIVIREPLNQVAANFVAVAQTSASQLEFQVGANAGQQVYLSLNDVSSRQLGVGASSLFSDLSKIDVTQDRGATEAIKVIDAAIAQISRLRGEMGAFQKNVLESNMRSLAIAKENLTATESAIRDVNFAEEISRFTRFQILQQAGMSVLGQANFAPQSVLQLIR